MKPTISKEGQRAKDRIAEFRQNVDNGATAKQARAIVAQVEGKQLTPNQQNTLASIQPTVSATDLVTPPAPVTPPVPQVNTNDGSRTANLVNNVATGTQQFITSQSEEAQKARELANLIGTQTFDAAGQRTQLNEQFGLPQNLARLTDIQTQLAQANTASGEEKVRIASGGQGIFQGQRSIQLEDRLNAVRKAGLAAEAAVLQGAIETASTLVNNAMQDFYQDRQLTNQNMINQLNYFQGIADEQTGQLLEQEKRKYEEDQRLIIRAESAIDAAMTSGFATDADVKKMTALAGDPASQTAYAQGIVANAAREAAYLDRLQKEASIAASNRSGATADLQRRQALYELATLGDPQAISELGWDPTAQLSEQANKQIDKQIDDILRKETQATKALSNKLGLQSSSGEWQFGEATLRGLTTSEKEIPGVGMLPGGISGAIKGRQQKATFLADVDNLITQEGLAEIGRLAEMGIKLTPITEKELGILFNSASVLNTASRRDDGGKLTGFTIPDYEVEEQLSQYLLSLANIKAELQAQKNLGSGAYAEIQALQNEQ